MPGINELLNLVLQLDAADRQEAAMQMQQQQYRSTLPSRAIADMARLQDPNQLPALRNFYAQMGMGSDVFDNLAGQYLPSVQQQQETMTLDQTRQMQGMPSQFAMNPQGQQLQRTVASNQLTGQTEGAVAENRAIANEMGDPNMFSPQAQKAHLFNRIGYQPGNFELGQAIAGLGPENLNKAAQFQMNLAIDPKSMAGLNLQRDTAQANAEMQSRELNFRNLQLSQETATRMMLGQMENNARMGELAAKAKKGDEESTKLLLDMIEESNKGGSDMHNQILDQMIRSQAGSIFDMISGQGRTPGDTNRVQNRYNLPKDKGGFAPGTFDLFFNKR